MEPRLRIGLDLDNTIINYSGLFFEVGLAIGMIPSQLARTKEAVKEYLQSRDKNDVWTEIQGLVYGKYLYKAKPFPGFKEFLSTFTSRGAELLIISHKTRFNVIGEKINLQDAASKWLEMNQISGVKGISPANIFFLESRQEKAQKITDQKCSIFVDDLPEVFNEPGFPPNVAKVFFNPERLQAQDGWFNCTSWAEVTSTVLRFAEIHAG